MLKQRNKEAVGIIYDNYANSLYGIILRIVHFEAVAEDALQDTFVKIWQNANSYDKTKGRFFTWIVNIARNLAIDVTRSKEYKYTKDRLEVDAEITPDKNINEYTGLKDLMDNLKKEQKEVLEMFYYQGKTQEEVSKELSIPIGTVKTRIRTAVNNMRKYFNYK